MNSYLTLIQKAKNEIDKGFDRLERKVAKRPIEIFLVTSTIRAIRLTDAIIELCKRNFTDESLPILRSLIETAVNMRWIMNAGAERRLEDYFFQLGEGNWFGGYWADRKLFDRMSEIGFSRRYYDWVVKFCHDYTHGNARSLPYGLIIPEAKRKEPMSPEAIYVIVAQMLGHVLKALDDHWSGKFSSYQKIWKEIKKRQS